MFDTRETTFDLFGRRPGNEILFALGMESGIERRVLLYRICFRQWGETCDSRHVVVGGSLFLDRIL